MNILKKKPLGEILDAIFKMGAVRLFVLVQAKFTSMSMDNRSRIEGGVVDTETEAWKRASHKKREPKRVCALSGCDRRLLG